MRATIAQLSLLLTWPLLFQGCAGSGKKLPSSGATDSENQSALVQGTRELEQREVASEVQIGRALSAAILGRAQLLSDGPLVRRSLYLRALGEVLSVRFGRPGLEHYFGWVNSDEINAFATPGGYVFLTRGLFERLRTEDELVGVLLHEIVHVSERHVYRQIAPPQSSGFGFALSRLFSGGRGDLGVAVSRAVTQGLRILFETGLGQDLEREADEHAVAMAAALGYDPEALAGFLGRAHEETRKKTAPLRLPATHPPLAERRAWLSHVFVAQKLGSVYREAKVQLAEGVTRERQIRFTSVIAN